MKRFFAVSGNRCEFPRCNCSRVDSASRSIRGEVWHIKGEKPSSARYDKAQTEKREY